MLAAGTLPTYLCRQVGFSLWSRGPLLHRCRAPKPRMVVCGTGFTGTLWNFLEDRRTPFESLV